MMKRDIRHSILCFAGAFLLPFASASQNAQTHDAEATYQWPEEPAVKAHIKAWQELKFGLFLHWGTYSQWGVVESWSLCPTDRDFTQRTGPYASDWAVYKKAYEGLQHTFNPVQFNPKKWATAAEAAGMRYVVFTTKHHDGFCMYDTRYTDYKITSPRTPFSSDPNADVSKAVFNAFRAKNFMVGAYFSKPDWHSQDYWWSYFPPKDMNESYDRAKYPERWQRFTRFTYDQVAELVTGYGKIDLLWFDGSWINMDMTDMVRMVRQKQPDIIIVDRHGKPEYVNYLTPEQKIPDHFIAAPWETCMTMGKSWSYNKDEEYKPARQLIQLLVDVVAKNGNLLLGIGPGPDGELHPTAYQRLADISKWMAVNAEAIHDTKPLPPYRQGKWALTGKQASAYAIYLPADSETLLPKRVVIPFGTIADLKDIRILGTDHNLKFKKVIDGFQVTIPIDIARKLAGEAAWVFKLT